MISVFYSPYYTTRSQEFQGCITISTQTPDETPIVLPVDEGTQVSAWPSCTLGELQQWVAARDAVIVSQFGTPTSPEPTEPPSPTQVDLPAHDTEVSL